MREYSTPKNSNKGPEDKVATVLVAKEKVKEAGDVSFSLPDPREKSLRRRFTSLRKINLKADS